MFCGQKGMEVMLINTSRFGEIEIERAKIISFQDGILGFESSKRFAIIRSEEMPVYWLVSLDEDVSLPCINTFEFFPDYAPEIPDDSLKKIGGNNEENLLIITTVVVREEPEKTTTNLAAPIVINPKNNKGAQIVLQDNEYEVRTPLFSEKEVAGNAGSVKKAQ